MKPESDDPSLVDLRRRMLAAGMRKMTSWIECEDGTADGSGGSRSKSDNQRQREQVERDKANGKAKCSFKTADDDESKELLGGVAKALLDGRRSQSPHFHNAVRAALHEPDTVIIGARVLALRGIRRTLVMHLIG